MIAKIKTNDEVYTATVFGFLGKGWKTRVIVMNKDNTALQIIKYWNPTRCVFELNTDDTGWITKGNFYGYDWIYEKLNKKLFGLQIDCDGILKKCQNMQSQVVDCEWYNVKNADDINNLDAVAINFHDACVDKIYKEADEDIIEFDAWGCRIILRLCECETNLYVGCGDAITQDGFWDGITESNMFIEDGYIYWVNNSQVNKSEDIHNDTMNRYFRAKSVKWKIVI